MNPSDDSAEDRQLPSDPVATLPPATTGAALDFMWQSFENLNEWVRFSDTKAGAILAADGIVVGALATVMAGSRAGVLGSTVFLGWVAVVLAGTFYSAAYALASLMPQLSLRRKPGRAAPVEDVTAEESSSLVFFMDIDRSFPTAAQFHATIRDALAEPDRAVREISHQVWANSKVAAVKYDRVTKAVKGLAFAMFVGFAGAITLAVYFIARSLHGS